MIYLNFKRDTYSYPHDVERIQRVFVDKGFVISRSGAHDAWDKYSDSFAAGWLILPDDDNVLFDAIRHYFD